MRISNYSIMTTCVLCLKLNSMLCQIFFHSPKIRNVYKRLNVVSMLASSVLGKIYDVCCCIMLCQTDHLVGKIYLDVI